MRLILLFLLAGLTALAPTIHAADGPAPSGSTGGGSAADSAPPNPVRAEIADISGGVDVADPLTLTVRVVNNMPDNPVQITEVFVDVPTRYRTMRLALGTDWQRIEFPTEKGKDTRIKTSTVVPINIPAADKAYWGIIPRSTWLCFVPAEEEIRVTVSYIPVTGAVGSGTATASTKINFEASPECIVVGGAAGAFFLAIFAFFYQLSSRLSTYVWPRKKNGAIDIRGSMIVGRRYLWVNGAGVVAQFGTGTLTAWILLLFLYYAKNMPLPVTIAVNDFFGAVLLGLFTHSMGQWVYQKLFTDNDGVDNTAATPAPNTGNIDAEADTQETPTGPKTHVPVAPLPQTTDPNAQPVGASENKTP